MLTKNENKVMNALIKQGQNKGAILISPVDLIKISGVDFTLTQIEKLLEDLKKDGYFDLVFSDRHGEKVYCIILSEKGKGYLRRVKIIKRNLIFKLFVTVGFAVLSFVIGLILKAVF